MRSPRTLVGLTVLLWVGGLWAWQVLPEPAPMHWNALGEVDGYGPAWQAALMPALIATLLAVLGPVLPRIDPRNRGYAGFSGTYWMILNTIVLFFGFILYATIAAGMNWPFAGSRVFLAAMGLLMAVLGNELGRVEPNYFVGIRTPWTLADGWVWQQTHRLGGRWMTFGGVLGCVLALTVPQQQAFWLVFPVTIAPALATLPASYILWRRRQAGAGGGSDDGQG